MLIIGCDYHPSVQQIAFVDTETGDYGERRLKHSDGDGTSVVVVRDTPPLLIINVRVHFADELIERLISYLAMSQKPVELSRLRRQAHYRGVCDLTGGLLGTRVCNIL